MSETTAPAVTLVEFLEARWQEAESFARAEVDLAAEFFPPNPQVELWYEWARCTKHQNGGAGTSFMPGAPSPAEVLTDIQVKRRILADRPIEPWPVETEEQAAEYDGALRQWESTVRLLALPYAGHVDYSPDWRPDE